MLESFVMREDVKNLQDLQYKLASADENVEEWLISNRYFEDNLKTTALCRTIKAFILNRPADRARLNQLIFLLKEKYPNISFFMMKCFMKI